MSTTLHGKENGHPHEVVRSRIRIARTSEMGMCFGVRDALEITDRIDGAHDITIHGELVHNEKVLKRLRERGFRMVAESHRGAPPATTSVLVTAHGISDRRREHLLRGGHRLIDTTCPLVRKVHVASGELAREGRLVLMLGKPGHVEVAGIVEDLDDFLVVSSPADVGEQAGIPTWHVAGPEELRAEWFAGVRTCGLTAGTSTLAGTIDAVQREMERLAASG